MVDWVFLLHKMTIELIVILWKRNTHWTINLLQLPKSLFVSKPSLCILMSASYFAILIRNKFITQLQSLQDVLNYLPHIQLPQQESLGQSFICMYRIADHFLNQKFVFPELLWPYTMVSVAASGSTSWVCDPSLVSYALEQPEMLRSPDYRHKCDA